MRIFAHRTPTESTHRAQQSIDLSIIIVSWNVWDLLRACLTSIERASQPMPTDADADPINPTQMRSLAINEAIYTLEVIVVDNASSDASADLIPTRFPWVHLVRSAENLGFTRGNNLGFAQAQGRFIYFLNPDTELADQSLARLLRAIVDEPTVGMVGPRLRYGDGMAQNSRRRFPTRLTGFF